MQIHKGRFAAKIEGDFVVFLIGMRINRLFHVNKWLPVTLAMPRMIKELVKRPDLGLLHAQGFVSGRTAMVAECGMLGLVLSPSSKPKNLCVDSTLEPGSRRTSFRLLQYRFCSSD